MYNFNPYNALLIIAANIPVLLMTGFHRIVCQICFANMLFLQLQLGLYLPNTYLKDVRSTGIASVSDWYITINLLGTPDVENH